MQKRQVAAQEKGLTKRKTRGGLKKWGRGNKKAKWATESRVVLARHWKHQFPTTIHLSSTTLHTSSGSIQVQVWKRKKKAHDWTEEKKKKASETQANSWITLLYSSLQGRVHSGINNQRSEKVSYTKRWRTPLTKNSRSLRTKTRKKKKKIKEKRNLNYLNTIKKKK